MWRFITRGVRDLRYAPSKPVDSTENVQKPSSIIKSKKKNCSILDYKYWKPTCFQWMKTNKSSEQSKQRNDDRINTSPHTLFEAFGWSGAIVFGWYIGQSILRNRNYFFQKKDNDPLNRPDFEYKSLTEVVTKVVLAQPQYQSILPTDSTRQPTQTSSHIQTYGPITREDNFNQAAQELYEVHKEMVAELENVRGLKLLKKKKLDDAISHFKQAVLLNHSSAAFNLAQCYENGWGTEKDLSQAVYYYEIAKDQGHVSAIYNLGVYYSKGLGGLQINNDKANELFLTAAKLGHVQAAQNIGLVKCPAPSLEDLSKMFEEQNSKSPYPGKIIKALETYMKTNDLTPDEAYHSDEPTSPLLWDSFVKEVHEYNQMWDQQESNNDTTNEVPFLF